MCKQSWAKLWENEGEKEKKPAGAVLPAPLGLQAMGERLFSVSLFPALAQIKRSLPSPSEAHALSWNMPG